MVLLEKRNKTLDLGLGKTSRLEREFERNIVDKCGQFLGKIGVILTFFEFLAERRRDLLKVGVDFI